MILFSNGCPKCRILKMTLDRFGVEYTVSDDLSQLEKYSIMSLPVLQRDDGTIMEFNEAMHVAQGGMEWK